MSITEIISIILICCGLFFALVGSVGILRLPGFYARTHAASKIDMLGVMFIIGGLIVFEGMTLTSLKLFLIFVFIALANPIGSHALGNSAFKNKLVPFLGDDKKTSEEDAR